MAAAALAHAGDDGVDAVDDADEVDANVRVDLGGVEGVGGGAAADAGAGDEQVRGAELRLEAADGVADGGEVGHVGDGAGDGLAVEVAAQRVERLGLEVEGEDAGAGGGEAHGQRPADAAGGAGDQRGAIAKGTHAADLVVAT